MLARYASRNDRQFSFFATILGTNGYIDCGVAIGPEP
jgi:hypothetical protein